MDNMLKKNSPEIPQLNIITMFRLGLFQVALGMMSVLIFGVFNRVLIKELGVPATLSTVILALSLFVAPARVLIGQLSDTKPLFGYYRTGYVWIGAVSLSILAWVAVQVMWQLGESLQRTQWSGSTTGWAVLLAMIMTLYGLAVSCSSTPFATLLVDVSEEDNRGQLVGIDWSMLIGGTIVGAITIGVLLKNLDINSNIAEVRNAINGLFMVIPFIVCALALIATWGIERKYSRFQQRINQPDHNEQIDLSRAWKILTASKQTQLFFTFLVMMTLGLFMQDPILETYGGDVFKMPIGATTSLNAFWGGGTLIGLSIAGFLLVPRWGKRKTANFGCLLVAFSMIFVIAAGFTAKTVFLQMSLLLFGVFSGIVTTGAISLMLDLTVPETAGTFIGAWGLSQALAKGCATILGGTTLDIGKRLFNDLTLAYSLVFLLQGLAMILAVQLLAKVNIQEFKMKAEDTIAAVISNES